MPRALSIAVCAAATAVAALDCTPSEGSTLALGSCNYTTGTSWAGLDPMTGAPGTIHLADTYYEGLCVDVGSNATRAAVRLAQCDPSRAWAQTFSAIKAVSTAAAHTAAAQLEGVLLRHAASRMCVTVAHDADGNGAALDLFECDASKRNVVWTAVPSGAGSFQLRTSQPSHDCVSACHGGGPAPPPPPPSPAGPASVTVNGSALADRFEGLWAMSANGAARQLWEYPEPTRSQILDLLFLPGAGTQWQALKVEIGGDVESSYGSMSSFKHTPNASEASFRRGVQWWLMKEARARNPSIPLYCLTWGLPYWVGPGGVLSTAGPTSGVQFHIDYLTGAQLVHNLTFDYIGIWNEAPWSKDYILALRKALDGNGFASTKIVAADGGTDIIDAAAKDPELAEAIGAFGLHAHVLPADKAVAALGKPYFNSENDLVDGVLPQWGGTETPGLSWPLATLLNYVVAGGTATMLCPGWHGWNQMLGRHTHGPAFFNDPWSGFYQLGAAFFTQAHITQFTEVGWRFIAGASGQADSGCLGDAGASSTTDASSPCLTYSALADPAAKDFTLVAVNTGAAPATLSVALAGTTTALCGKPLQRWQSTEAAYFVRVGDVSVPCGQPATTAGGDGSEHGTPVGKLTLHLAAQSVTTVSSRATAGSWANYSIPPRTRFPLPFESAWATQAVDEPCRVLSPVYGAFEIATARTAAGTDGPVCRQAVPQDPGTNAWTHRKNSWPAALMPGGSNAAHVVASVSARFETSGQLNPTSAVTLCGRTPIWAPAKCQPNVFALGVCLTVFWTSSATGNDTLTWRLTEANNQYHQARGSGCGEFATLGSGTLPVPAEGVANHWFQLDMIFSGPFVAAYIDQEQTATAKTSLLSGVVSIGTAWNTALFDKLSVTHEMAHAKTPSSSFLFDVLTGSTLVPGFDGWAGLVLNLTRYPASAAPVRVSSLGRFALPNSTQVHHLAVARASDGAWVVPPSAGLSVDLKSCRADALGFCYASPLPTPVELPRGDAYYVVSSESARGDALVEMTASATGADYAHYRSGDTLMTYALPLGAGAAPTAASESLVSGRVMSNSTKGAPWVTFTELGNTDTSFGPVNLLLG